MPSVACMKDWRKVGIGDVSCHLELHLSQGEGEHPDYKTKNIKLYLQPIPKK